MPRPEPPISRGAQGRSPPTCRTLASTVPVARIPTDTARIATKHRHLKSRDAPRPRVEGDPRYKVLRQADDAAHDGPPIPRGA
jgi:hypothetical protein